jgi:hypothetical protein
MHDFTRWLRRTIRRGAAVDSDQRADASLLFGHSDTV